MDNMRSHGISETNQHGLREHIRGYTLVDVTNSGVLAAYKDAPPFMDSAGQIVNSRETWERSRNQQRNWETFIQIASMITQPTILKKSTLIPNADLTNYNFSYDGTANVWEFVLGAEQTCVFDGRFPASRLADMCHKIPVITGLTESIDFAMAMFNTSGNVNLYFEKVSF